jgi:methanogenic corrinoid protein MtbC1
MIERAEAENRDKGIVIETEFDCEIGQWIDRVEKLDPQGLEHILRRSWAKHGAEDFILELAIPFLKKVGDRWFDKTISVAHEHFSSENLSSFLSNQWRPISRQAENGKAVVANLEGDFHCLGIHMASMFLALSSFEVVFLGPNTPSKDIVLAATENNVVTVVVGLNPTVNIEETASRLAEIRAAVPSSVTIVVGGNDNLPEICGVTRQKSLKDFADFVHSLSAIYRA